MTKEMQVMARFRCHASRIEEAKAILIRLAASTRAEAGCISYHYYQSLADPREFTSVEHWRSPEDEAAHWTRAHLTQALADLEGILDGDAQVTKWNDLEGRRQ